MQLGMYVARELILTPQERANRIKSALSELLRGKKPAEVANCLGVDPATVSRWKRRSKPSAENRQP